MIKEGLVPHRPSPKQLRFLLLPNEDAFYGGAAGGGKSDALFMGALMFTYVKNYSAIIFRKTMQEHQLPDGLIPRSKDWLMPILGKKAWNGSTSTWTFPDTKATVTFGYLENPDDHHRYQSSAYQYIGFDELPQFRLEQFRYMFSRLRKLEVQAEIPLRVRGAGNPEGRYVKWVKQRYVDVNADAPFIPAKIADNPGLDRDSYIISLNHLDPITRARLMNGDWEMRDVGTMFRRTWFTLTKTAPNDLDAVRYWDKASTVPKRGRDPDFTAGVLLARSKLNKFYVLDVKHFQGTPQENEQLIQQTAILDRERINCKLVRVIIEQEGGSSGVDVIDHYRRDVLAGFPFYADKVTGSKVERAASLSSMAEAGNIEIVVGNWNIDGFLDELETFPEADHDDRVDATSGAFRALTFRPPLGGSTVDKIWRE